jgi:hypothetical protein
MKKTVVLLVASLVFSACTIPESSTDKERRQQENLSQRAMDSIGVPAIVNFQEKRILKDIIEMRDTSIVTYTYLVSEYNSKLTKFCDSVGFGIPAATQFTNPMRYEINGATLPQADPNGLYSPSSAEGTWILCKNPTNKDVKPVYVEPRIVVSPFPLDI